MSEPRQPIPRAFTLVELLVVLAILAVLAAILVPNFVRSRAQGRVTACKSNLKNIGTALEMYSTDHSKLYPLALDRLTPNYLKSLPTCPNAGRNTYSEGFTSASQPSAYTVVCAGYNHKAQGIGPNYPQYNSVSGLVEK
ncbi:MAG TPA: type II secretion system protein [Candidatus Nitrosotenuis sp.]|nr:type II secretion system protein [Candidatus Nitrosotenuis sp.]